MPLQCQGMLSRSVLLPPQYVPGSSGPWAPPVAAKVPPAGGPAWRLSTHVRFGRSVRFSQRVLLTMKSQLETQAGHFPRASEAGGRPSQRPKFSSHQAGDWRACGARPVVASPQQGAQHWSRELCPPPRCLSWPTWSCPRQVLPQSESQLHQPPHSQVGAPQPHLRLLRAWASRAALGSFPREARQGSHPDPWRAAAGRCGPRVRLARQPRIF